MFAYLAQPICWIVLGASFAASLLLTPLVKRLARSTGAIDGGGYRKINRRPIPRLGGLAVALPFLAVCLLGILDPTRYLSLPAYRQGDFALLGLGGALVLALGVCDDIFGLSPKLKFLVQGVVGLLFCAAGKSVLAVDLPLVGLVPLGVFFGGALTVLWLVGVMNAFNLIDGVDGLASSLALIAATGLGAIAALNGASNIVVVLAAALAGSLAAFLIFNFHPASIFLGDTGSLFLGYVLASMALLSESRASGTVMLVTPVMVLALPIFDTLSSMGRRVLRGHSPFQGDRRHTHHRLLELGLGQRQVALTLGCVSLWCTASAVLTQAVRSHRKEVLALIAVGAAAMLAVAWANGYLRLRHARRLARRRARNARMAAFADYAAMVLGASVSRLGLQDVVELACRELELECLEVADGATGRAIAGSSAGCSAGWNPPADLADEDEEDEGTGTGLEVLRLEDAERRPLLIRYRLSPRVITVGPPESEEDTRESARLEREDVAACLARLFGRARLGNHLALLPAPSGHIADKAG